MLDLNKPPVVIDEPGLYAIQQNWQFAATTADAVPELIQITADDVTLDLHGFTISEGFGGGPSPATLLVITGDNAEVRNGGIDAHSNDVAVRSTGSGPWLHHLSIRTGDENPGLTFEGNGTTISDSEITFGIVGLAGESILERNTFRTRFGVATLTGNGNRVMNNLIFMGRGDAGVRIPGNGNVVADNVMEGNDLDTAFSVDGDYNVLRGNTVVVKGAGVGTISRISGTGNTLDGNIAPPPEPNQGEVPAGNGIVFTADGNFYGDNRMAAGVPFALGGTVQTDWGGNVGY